MLNQRSRPLYRCVVLCLKLHCQISRHPRQESPLQANSPLGGGATQMPAKCSRAGWMSGVEIDHVRYINILIWLARTHLHTKRTPPNIAPSRCKKNGLQVSLSSFFLFYKVNSQTKEKKSICQEWDSNPRLHLETRTSAPNVFWESI